MGDKNVMVLYIISALIMIGGFVMIFMTRSTAILAGGAVLVFIGLFIFLFGREKAKTTRA